MLHIRPATAGDAAAITRIQVAGWQAAYPGLLPADVISKRVLDDGGERVRLAMLSQPWRTTLLAEAAPRLAAGAGPAAGGGTAAHADRAAQPVGYASFGPERDPSRPLGSSQVPAATGAAELYAIYVLPAWWSAGVGRRLIGEVLARVTGRGYQAISLWVLAGNVRARRFYERAGFTATGDILIPDWLGGAAEVRYRRALPAGDGDRPDGG